MKSTQHVNDRTQVLQDDTQIEFHEELGHILLEITADNVVCLTSTTPINILSYLEHRALNKGMVILFPLEQKQISSYKKTFANKPQGKMEIQ